MQPVEERALELLSDGLVVLDALEKVFSSCANLLALWIALKCRDSAQRIEHRDRS